LDLRLIQTLRWLLPALLLAACAAPAPRSGPDAFARHALAKREQALAESPERRRDPEREAQILRLLCEADAGRCGSLRVYLIERESPVADLSEDGVLRVFLSLLRHLESEDELAFVLAHETAHLSLGHFAAMRLPGWDATGAEVEADAWARRRLAANGRDDCAGARLLPRLERARELKPAEREALGRRLQAMGC
jgi:hypothetical protein